MAKRFHFKLEAVLKVRKQKEDEKKRIVAGRIREIAELRYRVLNLNEQISSSVEEVRTIALGQRLDVGLVSRQRYWISHMQRGVLETELQIGKLEAQLVKDRRALTEASKEVKVIEKLRDKALERYQRELNRLEIIEADEQVIQRFIHRHREVKEL